jgi:hypothetical protein
MIKRSKQIRLRNKPNQIQIPLNLICTSSKELKLQNSNEHEIFILAHTLSKDVLYQRSQENKLVCKSYAQYTF